MTTIKIKRLNSSAFLPERKTDGAAGYDLFVPQDVIIRDSREVVKLGFAMEIPEGYCVKIRARSGCTLNGMPGMYRDSERRFDYDVQEGLVDCDYRGEVGVLLLSRDPRPMKLKRGTRIAQMTVEVVPCSEIVEVDELSDTDRKGGFGHTGIR